MALKMSATLDTGDGITIDAEYQHVDRPVLDQPPTSIPAALTPKPRPRARG